jgi:hypothetical protein
LEVIAGIDRCVSKRHTDSKTLTIRSNTNKNHTKLAREPALYSQKNSSLLDAGTRLDHNRWGTERLVLFVGPVLLLHFRLFLILRLL